jgi:uncharacterized protein (TIGR02001 family)
MKKLVSTSLLCLGAALPAAVLAQAKAEPDYTLTANVTLASEYIYRGITQTNNKPAIQGGFDFVHKSGFYLGNWNSNISWLTDGVSNRSAPVEMDFYGGYKFAIAEGFTLDIGGLYYYYPISGNKPDPSPNTFELYVGGSWGPLTLKYSHAFTELFGFPDSKNSYYIDGTLNYPIADTGFALLAHVGYQKIKTGSATASCADGTKDYSYADWKVGGTYGWDGGWTLGAYYSDTNAAKACFTGPVGGKNLGDGRFLVTVGRSF